MKIFIGIMLITILIISGIGVYFVLGDDSGPIPPYEGDGQSDPDSGDTNDEGINYAVKFITPTGNYNIPGTGVPEGKFAFIPITVRAYGLDVSDIQYFTFEWVGESYARETAQVDTILCKKIDEYNIDAHQRILIQKLGAGKHLLRVRIWNRVYNIWANEGFKAEAQIEINVPSFWVYHWDSRNPVLESEVYRGYDGGKYFYGFTFPFYAEDSYDDYSQLYFLEGKICRVKGQIKTRINMCEDLESKLYAWYDIWDGVAKEWTVINENVPATCNGWTEEFEIQSNHWGNEIGFALRRYDIVEGFIGEVHVKPGTIFKGESPLDFVLKLFNGDSRTNPPYLG